MENQQELFRIKEHKQHVRGALITFTLGLIMLGAAILGDKIGIDFIGKIFLGIFGSIFLCASALGAQEP